MEMQNLPGALGVTLILGSGLLVFLRECQTKRIVFVEKRGHARYSFPILDRVTGGFVQYVDVDHSQTRDWFGRSMANALKL